MKAILSLFVLALVVVAAHEEATYDESSPVISLTDSDFEARMKTLPTYVMVEFYAPWCGHCKHLKPVYEEAATEAKKTGKVAFVAVDATVSTKLAEKYGVQGFPTLKIFKNGEFLQDFDGDRSASALLEALESHARPASIQASSVEEVEAAISGKSLYALAYFTKENDGARKSYVDACETSRALGVRFVEITSAATAEHYKLGGAPSFVVFRPQFPEGEEKQVSFDFFTEAGFNSEKISAFISGSIVPLLDEISADNYRTYERRKLPFFWLFTAGQGENNKDEDGKPQTTTNPPEVVAKNNEVKAVVRKVAEKYNSKLSFVYLSGEDYADHAQQLSAGPTFPSIVISGLEEHNKRYVYPANAPMTVDALSKWVADYAGGKLTPTIKSEAVPTAEEQEKNVVKVIVANNMKEMLYENPSDVFVMFYAPWCQHCKQVKPIWEELAQLLKDTKGITIAKMDATANDGPSEVTGFPMFYFHKGGQTEHKLYEGQMFDGDRTKDGFLLFLKKNTSADLGKLPADIDKIESFLKDIDNVRDEIKRLLNERAELKSKLAAYEKASEKIGDIDAHVNDSKDEL